MSSGSMRDKFSGLGEKCEENDHDNSIKCEDKSELTYKLLRKLFLERKLRHTNTRN